VLRDVKDVDTSTTVLGTTLPVPMILAPVGGPRLFHHDGELAVARAAGHAQLPYAVSTLSTVPLERVAREATGPLWFQLYVWGDRETSKELIERAKAAGYAALIVTVDCTVRSKRERELRAGVTLPTTTLTMRSIRGRAPPVMVVAFPDNRGAHVPEPRPRTRTRRGHGTPGAHVRRVADLG
jgi:L-lactate dehydrogenase (cytochrome)